MSFAAAVLVCSAAIALYGRERELVKLDASAAPRPATPPHLGQVPATLAQLSASDAGEPVPGAPCENDDDCAEVFSCCGGYCTDLQHDRLSCGACDQPCGGTLACVEGACADTCDVAPCPAGFLCLLQERCERSDCATADEGADCALDTTRIGSCCGQVCVDTTQTSAHCGQCDTPCPADQFCAESECQPHVDCRDAGGAICALGRDRNGLCCSDRCSDDQQDPKNCGACGKVCAPGEICNLGDCAVASCEGVPSDEVCVGVDGGPNGTCCDGRCLSASGFLRDVADCGGCKAHCPPGAQCTQGTCTEPDSGRPLGCERNGCPQDQVCMPDGVCLRKGCSGADDNLPCAESSERNGVCCGQVCTDVNEDPANCGRCRLTCDAGELCGEGVCSPFTGCGSEGQTICPLPGARNGVCCGTACVDTDHDPANCGSCGQACMAGRTCDRAICRALACANSQSGEYCVAPNGVDAECCHGSCVTELSLESDSANCGDCGIACPSGLPCVDGSCTEPDSGGTWSCAEGGCPAGQVCVSGEHCAQVSCSGAEDGLKCGGSQADVLDTCCGQQCVDLRFDSQNCGLCGNPCGAGQFCLSASCQGFAGCDAGADPCPLSPGSVGLCCANGCTDVENDPRSCGGCNHVCPPGVACAKGQCASAQSQNH